MEASTRKAIRRGVSSVYNVVDVHAMLDEIPTDNESGSDDDPEYTIPDAADVLQLTDSEDETTPDVLPLERSSGCDANILQKVEAFMDKHQSENLTPVQIQMLQKELPKTSMTKVKSLVECAKRRWKHKEQTQDIHDFQQPQGTH